MSDPIRRSLVLAALVAVSLTASPSLAADAPATTPAPAHPTSGIVGIDAMTATVFQEGQSSFSGVALRVRVKSARLVPSIEFLPTIEYWQNSNKIEAVGLKTTRRDGTIGGDARWTFAHPGWRPYAGVGLGIHFLEEKVNAPTLGLYDESHATVRGGIDFLGGVSFGGTEKLGSFIEAKFHDVTHYRQLKFNTGLTWSY